MEFSRQEYWSVWCSLLQDIFLTQELNLGLLHCRQKKGWDQATPISKLLKLICLHCSLFSWDVSPVWTRQVKYKEWKAAIKENGVAEEPSEDVRKDWKGKDGVLYRGALERLTVTAAGSSASAAMAEAPFTFHWWTALKSVGLSSDIHPFFLRFVEVSGSMKFKVLPVQRENTPYPRSHWLSDIAKVLSFRIKMGGNHPLSLIQIIQAILHSHKIIIPGYIGNHAGWRTAEGPRHAWSTEGKMEGDMRDDTKL